MPHELQRRWSWKCTATFSGPAATSLTPNWWVQLGNKVPVWVPVSFPIRTPIPRQQLHVPDSQVQSSVISAEIFKLPKLVGKKMMMAITCCGFTFAGWRNGIKRIWIPFAQFSVCSCPRGIRRISGCLFIYSYLYFLFRESLISSFWKWYSRVKTLIRLARLKGVAESSTFRLTHSLIKVSAKKPKKKKINK